MWHKLSIASDKDEHLLLALKTLTLPKIIGMKQHNKCLYLFNKVIDGVEKIPFSSNKPEFLKHIIKAWLSTVEYPKETDHDGGNSKGFEIFVYANGGYCDIVEDQDNIEISNSGWNINIVVKPYWVEYHK